MIHLVPVPPKSVEPIWPRLDAAYEEACKHAHGTLTKDVIRLRAIAGNCTLWIAADDSDTEVTASCATSEVAFPGGLRAMFVEVIAGGKKFDIFDFRATLEKRAKADGCNAVFFILPRRWAKQLPDYEERKIFLIKELA